MGPPTETARITALMAQTFGDRRHHVGSFAERICGCAVDLLGLLPELHRAGEARSARSLRFDEDRPSQGVFVRPEEPTTLDSATRTHREAFAVESHTGAWLKPVRSNLEFGSAPINTDCSALPADAL